jgi:2,3-bisphosphoglycerate-dependent phosphoglycerate mutase
MLILVRHGQSEWNAKNLFTGWREAALTEQGKAQAKAAGALLNKKGLVFDCAFTSALARAQDTCKIILDVMDQASCPMTKDQALNERDYGALSGMNKDEARKKFGEAQVHIWRRSFNIAPPEGESLEDTAKRVLPYYKNNIQPLWDGGQTILVAAHGNSLRALVMFLENLTPEEIVEKEIATGEPIIYSRQNGQVKKL